MQNKSKDTPYNGVNPEKIKNANPKINIEELKIHYLYLTERHEIYKKKEILKLPREEWTQDEVFKVYKFTNVRRELDRESRWLIQNISTNPKLDLEEKVLFSILFRTWNKGENFDKLNLIECDIKNISLKDIDDMRLKIKELNSEFPKYCWFTSAFNTGGVRGTWAIPETRLSESGNNNAIMNIIDENGELILTDTWRECKKFLKENNEIAETKNYKIQGVEDVVLRPLHLVKYCNENKIYEEILNCLDAQSSYKILLSIPGFGKFLAYQVFVDLTYIPEFPFSENEFVVSGPGCDRGLNMIFVDKDGMTYEECLFWFRDNLKRLWEENNLKYYPEELFDHLPEFDRNYNIMMLENSFCEHSKNSRVRKGIGRPKVKYKERF